MAVGKVDDSDPRAWVASKGSHDVSESDPIAHSFTAADRVTVVSGLPRSGTSLLMQVLEAAGLSIARDESRARDADNPRGYYELAAAKRIRSDARFLAGCRGSVVKLVAPLLLELPPQPACRVLFMERDLGEVLASQRAMLARQGKPDSAAEDHALARAFESTLARCRAWLAREAGPSTLFVPHRALIESPAESIARLARFLEATGGGKPGPAGAVASSRAREAMARVVDPTLYRQRGGHGA